MKLSKKDINEFINVTKGGEKTPVIYKEGKRLVPTNEGYKTKKKPGNK